MTTTLISPRDVSRTWHVVDAADKPLGRLAVRVAEKLRGRGKVSFTPHVDNGDFVVVINAGKVKLTGRKEEQKMYERFSGYRGGRRVFPAAVLRARHPERMITLAVKGMLPKNKQSRGMLKRLKVYADDRHPHRAQVPAPLDAGP